MSSQLDNLLNEYKKKLLKSIDHLEFSYKKVQKLSSEPTTLNDDDLAMWESFSARFSRSADIFSTKYLKTLLRKHDPAYNGTLIDSLNWAEKQNLIKDAQVWYKIRELRNIEAHEYTEETLRNFFESARDLAPHILSLKKVL